MPAHPSSQREGVRGRGKQIKDKKFQVKMTGQNVKSEIHGLTF
jgi:hypothetical protein